MPEKIGNVKEEHDQKLAAICMPHQGQFVQELSHLFWRIELPEKYKPIYLASRSTDIVTARNSLVKAALEEKNVEWLLFIDSDQNVSPDIPKRLIQRAEENDIKILSALTFLWKQGIPVPLLPKSDGKDGGPQYSFSFIEESGLVETQRVGTGCLLVHRDVFEDMGSFWFENEFNEYGIRSVAEDFKFSEKAVDLGYQPYISSTEVVGHIKQVDLKEIVMLLDYAIHSESMEDFLAGF